MLEKFLVCEREFFGGNVRLVEFLQMIDCSIAKTNAICEALNGVLREVAAIPQPPPSLVTALHLAALRFRPVATIAIEIAIVVMVTVVVVVAPRVT